MLTYTKTRKIAARRREYADLQPERKQHTQAVQDLTRQVEQITAELADAADTMLGPELPAP